MFRTLVSFAVSAMVVTVPVANADDIPAPFGGITSPEIALVRYLSEGDFFEAYLTGVQRQVDALGADLTVYDSKEDADRQAAMLDQAVAAGVDGIIVQHGLPEAMKPAVARAVAAGIPVVAFDVELDNPAVPQVQQSDRDLAALVLEQMIRDNGDSFKAAYVHVKGIAPLDLRDETWQAFKTRYPGIDEVAAFGTIEAPVAQNIHDLAGPVLAEHPDVNVVFAPYDEFADGVYAAVLEAGRESDISIYSADISTRDIQEMRAEGSPWAATAATNPQVVGAVSVRAVAMLMAGEAPGDEILLPPTLVTRDFLNRNDITDMAGLAAELPQFDHADVLMPDWMPRP